MKLISIFWSNKSNSKEFLETHNPAPDYKHKHRFHDAYIWFLK